MNVRNSRWQQLAAWAAVSAIMWVLASCQGSGSNAANAAGCNELKQPELFAIPPDQNVARAGADGTAHDADSIPPADRGCGLQQFSHHACHHPGQRTGQPGSGGSRAESNSGPADVVRGKSGLLAIRTNYLKAKDAYSLPKGILRARTCTSITRLLNRTSSRQSRPRCRRTAIWYRRKLH